MPAHVRGQDAVLEARPHHALVDVREVGQDVGVIQRLQRQPRVVVLQRPLQPRAG